MDDVCYTCGKSHMHTVSHGCKSAYVRRIGE